MQPADSRERPHWGATVHSCRMLTVPSAMRIHAYILPPRHLEYILPFEA